MEPVSQAKRAAKRKRNFITVGHVKLPWYTTKNNGLIVDPRAYGRGLICSRDHEKALAEGRRLAVEINAGGVALPSLTAEQRAQFGGALQAAQEFGVSVPEMVAEWRSAKRKIVGCKQDLLAVVDAGVLAVMQPVHNLPDIAADFIAATKLQTMDERTRRDLVKQIGDLAISFPGPIHEVTSTQIEEWIEARKHRGAPLSKKRKKHIRANVVKFFKFAREKGKLPDDKKTEAQKTTPYKGRVRIVTGLFTPEEAAAYRAKGVRVIGIFTPSEIDILLRYIEEPDSYWIALNSFTGGRIEEIVKSKHARADKDWLRWEDFDWQKRIIRIRAEVAKTQVPRQMPILDNLWHWLQKPRDEKWTGLIIEGTIDVARERVKRRLARLAKQTDIFKGRLLKWPENGLRHSYASYRLAVLRDYGPLSVEMGNSVSMLQQHYVNPRTESEAQAYFSIFPANTEKIIQLVMPGMETAKVDASKGKTAGEEILLGARI